MELGEKLQELRNSRGLTQEELAEALFVSRTAVSKWETGRGYPSIDSLKMISCYFSVSIDSLLSGEKLLFLAENEKKSEIQGMRGWLMGMIDLFHILLIFLPLYPKTTEGIVCSVNLMGYTEISPLHKTIYWVLYLLFLFIGIREISATKIKTNKDWKAITGCSLLIEALAILLLALSREAYATALCFVFFLAKAVTTQK